VVTSAPNFAFELVAQRGLPDDFDDLDLSNVVLINGSEPVSIDSIANFNKAFAPYGLPGTAVKPSYGMAEATLFVSSTEPNTEAKVVHLDRRQLGAGRAVRVAAAAPHAVAHVCCGRISRSQWGVIVNPDIAAELPDDEVGEIWLHGNNIGRAYWARNQQTQLVFGNKLQSRLSVGSHADGAPIGADWLRTGDLGVYLDGELYILGRIKDLIIVDGRNHYPEDIEATAVNASQAVRARVCRGVLGAGQPNAANSRKRHRRTADHRRRTGPGRGPGRPATGGGGHQSRGVSPPWGARLGCAAGGGGFHPAHHERKAGPSGVPRTIPRWPIRPVLAKPHHGQACMPQVFAKRYLCSVN
jgi:fatty-acyl-CoA synthase